MRLQWNNRKNARHQKLDTENQQSDGMSAISPTMIHVHSKDFVGAAVGIEPLENRFYRLIFIAPMGHRSWTLSHESLPPHWRKRISNFIFVNLVRIQVVDDGQHGCACRAVKICFNSVPDVLGHVPTEVCSECAALFFCVLGGFDKVPDRRNQRASNRPQRNAYTDRASRYVTVPFNSDWNQLVYHSKTNKHLPVGL